MYVVMLALSAHAEERSLEIILRMCGISTDLPELKILHCIGEALIAGYPRENLTEGVP